MPQTIVTLLAAYFGVGLIFALWFITVGAGRLDHVARGAGIGFRLLILPGAAALWPVLAAVSVQRKR